MLLVLLGLDSLECLPPLDWKVCADHIRNITMEPTGFFSCKDPSFEHADSLSNCMGLALQKTNIIRDYLEVRHQRFFDYVQLGLSCVWNLQDINAAGQSRMFWPKEIWRMYGEKLEDFREPQNIKYA